MMMNHYDYDGSSLPENFRPRNGTKNMFSFLGEGKERAYNALSNWKHLSGNLSTFDAKERNSENPAPPPHYHHHHHHHQQQQRKKNQRKTK